MKTAILVSVTATSFCLALAACGFGPQPDTSTFYVLSSLDEIEMTGESLGPPTPGLAIGIGPVSFPAYLARGGLVTRLSDHQVDISNEEWWAEPFPESVRQTLAENLSTLLGTKRLYRHPWHSSTRLDYTVEMNVYRFEREASGVVRLMSRWVLREAETGRELLRRETHLEEPASSTDAGAAVAAQSRVLAAFSREIASAIRAASRDAEAGGQ